MQKVGRARGKADGEPRELGKDAARGRRDTKRDEIARKMAALLDAVFSPIFLYIYRCSKI